MNMKPNFQQDGQQINLNVMGLENLRCANCENQVFQPLFVVKKVSAIQSPTGKDSVVPMQIFACTNCGAVPKELGAQLLEVDHNLDSEEIDKGV